MDNNEIFRDDYPDLSDAEFESLELKVNEKHMNFELSAPAADPAADKTPSSWRQVEITQDWSYGWTPDNVQKFLDGWSVVAKYAYIGHDKDYKSDCKTPRNPHTHLFIKFNNPMPSAAIIARAKAVGLPDDCITENRLQKIGKWKAALNYMTHRDEHLNYKHVYSVLEVHSNFDWEAECEKYHSEKDLKPTNIREKEIVEGIFNGTIKEYNLKDHMTPYEMVKYDSAISKSLKHVALENMKEERDMQVIFISGPSRVGKDTFAVEWCKKNKLDYYRTNNNPESPFDNYRGEPVIIWSDARDDIYKPHNLHQLLDNHYSSMQKSRYHDRYIAAQYMLITSIKPLEKWYTEFYKKENEDKTQLYARILTQFVLDKDKVNIYTYNQDTNKYDYVWSMPNIYRHEDTILSTREKQLDYVKGILGGMADLANFASENIDNPAYPVFSAPSEPAPENPFAGPSHRY